MNVETITMDPEQAKQKMLAYKKQCRKKADEEYKRLEIAYGALADGYPLINPFDAIRSAGWNDQGLPNLAIARADRQWVALTMYRDGKDLEFNCSRFTRWDNRRYNAPSLWFPVRDMPERPVDDFVESNMRAMVPLIPADVYPSNEGEKKDWHILFEAEWEPYVPPVDPILMKRVHGDLFAILAAWDLTEVERAVLGELRRDQ